MNYLVPGVSKSLLVLAMMSSLAACGGGGGGGDTSGGGGISDGGGAGEIPTEQPEQDGDDETTVTAVEWNYEKEKLSQSGNLEKDPVIGISESGDLVASWIDNDTAFARFYDKSSDTWSATKQLHSMADNIFEYVWGANQEIKFAGDTAMVVWTQNGVAYSAIHDANGWSGNAQIIGAEDEDLYANSVTLAAKPDGSGFVAAYEVDNRRDGIDYVEAAEFSITTSQWSDQTALEYNTEDTYFGVQLAADEGSNAVHAVYESKLGQENQETLRTSTLMDGSWSAPESAATGYFGSVTVEADPESDRPIVIATHTNLPKVSASRKEDGTWVTETLDQTGERKAHIDSAVMADGDVLIGYTGEPSPGMEQIFTQRLDVETGVWSNKRGTDNQFRVFHPSVAADANGRAVVAYYQYNSWVTDYMEGQGWSEDFQPAGLNSGRETSVVMNDAGDTAMIWRDSNSSGGIFVLLGR